MRLIIGVPVMNKKDMTADFLAYLGRTIADRDDTTVIVIDNGSKPRYLIKDLPKTGLLTYIIHNPVNQGFYKPLGQLLQYDPAELVALAHNDLLFYEQGWDRRLKEAYAADPVLGIVGVCGSDQVDLFGGRGGGTMCYFRGERGQSQDAGLRITTLEPAAILDSMFMAFRREVAELLVTGEEPTPAHFYDKIWPMRAMEAGWKVAVLGTEVDHLGGTTLVAEPAFWPDMERWCREHGIEPGENPTMAVYLEAERRWLTEFREQKGLMPGRIDIGWVYRRD